MLSHALRAKVQNTALPAVPTDPNFKQVSLLLHGDGTNGAQNNTFLDSSTNNFTVTRNGNTTQGTNTPFSQAAGYWSNYFAGSGTYLSVPNNAAYNFGTGDFTIECWFNLSALGTTAGDYLLGFTDTGGNGGFGLSVTQANKAQMVINTGTNQVLVGTTNVALNTWNHIAGVRNGSTFTLYLNGVSQATYTSANAITSRTEALYIGGVYLGGSVLYPTTGYISNVRIVKGTAVYTSAFTPPTTPLTAITNTSLLTCQSNNFKDNSSNNFTITRNGDTSVQPFSPFAPTAAYSTSVNGGSMYFDGTEDYLIASNTMSALTGDFTIECWIYCPITTDTIVASSDGNTNFQIFRINQGVAGNVSVYWYTNADLFGYSTKHININTWNHLALTRVGSTAYLYVNGVQVASKAGVTDISCKPNVVGSLWLGGSISTAIPRFNGYVSNYRVVNGTAVYTANFTPPTAPLTAITNTSLLLNGTNAGIVDNASKNDLETVGNAQISTSVKKFGTGSMRFDGTGDYLVTNSANTDLFAFGSGNFTIEFWIYPTSFANDIKSIYDQRPTSTQGLYPTIYFNTSGVILYYTNSANRITGSALSTNTWYHVAVSRSGTSTRMFVDGVQVGSTYTDSNIYLNSSGRPFIGAFSDNQAANQQFNGYIDDLRITKGVARYTANFTPPTAAFPNQ